MAKENENMKHIIKYLEYTKENYDKEFPAEGELGEEVFRGRVKKEIIESDSCKEAWQTFMEQIKDNGWELYTWNAIIKNGIVRSAISVADAAKPNHSFGYDIKTVISKVAENAQIKWYDDSKLIKKVK